jgi:hypothetical protein
MISTNKKLKLQNAIKAYRKQYLTTSMVDLDESGTRIMINTFLSDVLGYKQLEEIKTEYMIRGTYADYVIQLNGVRHFLVEVKSLSLELSEKHLRQTINYGANEGIEYALLTNGRSFDFYKILFEKPINSRKIFSVDLGDAAGLKQAVDMLQYLHKDSAAKKGFKLLWNRCEATDPFSVAGMLLSDPIISHIRKLIRSKFEEKCNEDEIYKTVEKIITDKMDVGLVKHFKTPKRRLKPTIMPIKSIENVVEEKVLPESENGSNLDN